jgi:hypothetical protein
MKDGLQNRAGGIGDVSILPVEFDAVLGAVPVVEAQCASASRYCKLLIKRAVSNRLVPEAADWARGWRGPTHDCRVSTAVEIGVGDERH